MSVLKRFLCLSVIVTMGVQVCGCSVSVEYGDSNTETTQTIIETESSKSKIESTASVEETTEDVTVNPVEETYKKAISLHKSDLSGSEGNWEYDGIKLTSDDCEWIDSILNIDGTVNQGAIYRKMAMSLEGFTIGNSWETYAELLLGFMPENRDEFKPYVENAQVFITTKDVLESIMTAFEKLECVNGDFDFDSNSFDFKISDVSVCAEELQISEKMLGYIFAMLDEYAVEIEFDDSTCEIKYEK